MKKFILGVIVGAVLFASGSVMAYFNPPSVTKMIELTPAEQIKLGYAYNQYTGEKLIAEPEVSPLEKRLSDIEARITKLEQKHGDR